MIEQAPKPDRIIVSDYPSDRLLKLMVLGYGSEGVMNITTGLAKVHAPFSVASLPASAWHPILIGFVWIGLSVATLYERVLRPTRIELSPAGVTLVKTFRRKQFWPWRILEPFRRGSRPFSIEAPRTDDPSAMVYLPELSIKGDEKLATVLNIYRAALT
ncbi:hypothetical protein ACOSOMT5_P1829 [Acidiphilium sp. MT5]